MNLYYHAGFAYLVTRRYKDAIRTFSQVARLIIVDYLLTSRDQIISHFNRLAKTGALVHVVRGGSHSHNSNGLFTRSP